MWLSPGIHTARESQLRQLEAENEELRRVLSAYQAEERGDDDEPADAAWLVERVNGMVTAHVWEMGNADVGRETSIGFSRAAPTSPLRVTIQRKVSRLEDEWVVLFDPSRGHFRAACRLMGVEPRMIEAGFGERTT